MTVQAAARPVPDVDRDAAEQQFTEIYQQLSARLVQYIYWRLPFDMTDMAQDFAQDTFQDLWEHLLKGRQVDYPFAFLKTIASRRMADHHKIKRNSIYLATDLEAPEFAVVEVARGHQYAHGSPELNLLSSELDAAMERMRAASARWRKLHAQVAAMKKEHTRAAAVQQRDVALTELQDACWTVGDLRAELERAAGGSWRSQTGWPGPVESDGRHRKGGASSDLDVTHCVNGHRLHLENVTFLESGIRACRTCQAANTRRVRAKAAGR